jgi:MFS family permease
LSALTQSAAGAFRVRSFRFQWPADLATSWAFEMETLVLGWYILSETKSVRMLVLFGALQFFGALVAPLFGVAGDRFGHRRLLIITRASYGLLALLLAGMNLAGMLSPAHVFAVTALAGLIRPSDMLFRNTLISRTMPPAQLLGALGLSRATIDSARIAGALSGAGLAAYFGFGAAYGLILLLYLTSFGLSLGVARDLVQPAAKPSGSHWRDLRQVVAYVWEKPELLVAMGLAFLANLLAYPFVLGLLPYFAKDVLLIGQTGLGKLAASFASGCLIGSIALSLRRTPLRPARSMLLAGLIWFLLTCALAASNSLGGAAVLLLVIGIAQSYCMVPLAAVMLRASRSDIQGRVMGMRMLAVWGMPLGLLFAGVLIDWIGFRASATIYGVTGTMATIAIALRWRRAVWRSGASANVAM